MGKIGIMGGTFDPIHHGHLMLGKQAYMEYGLDLIWYMPSGQPPHKKNRLVTSTDRRCDMVKLAIADDPRFAFSDFEASRDGNTYTSQTLALLKKTYPEHEFYFIIGADSLYELETWYHPEEFLGTTVLLVAGRAYEMEHRPIDQQIEYLKEKYHARIHPLHCAEVKISSEEIRSMVNLGKSVITYVPKEVVRYIEREHLYKENVDEQSYS